MATAILGAGSAMQERFSDFALANSLIQSRSKR